MKIDIELIEKNLLFVMNEIQDQSEVGKFFPKNMQSYADQMSQLQEFILVAGEYGIAYELMVALLESFPFRISGAAAIKLLEVGLIFRFKTEREEDARFDTRDTAFH